MIKNERQYRITKAQAGKFEQALKNHSDLEADSKIHPLIQKAQRDAITSQFTDLQAQMREYDALRSGERKVLELTSFDELPRALIQARIALGLSQKTLAERLGIKEQQLQRYEATEYASASIERVREVINILGLTIRKDIFLPDVQITSANMFKRLNEAGLKKDFVLNKLIPRSVAAQIQAVGKPEEKKSSTLQAATTVSRVLGCSVASLFGDAPLELNNSSVRAVRFLVKAGANARKLNAYTIYAIYLAHLTLDATADLPQKAIPTDAAEFRGEVLEKFGSLEFENILKYFWSLGVPVLPLRDSGAFHGACIREDGRNVIVLKQQTASVAKWIHDVLHEGYHAGQEPDKSERETIEYSETSKERREMPEEKAASKFAGDVELDNRAEELAQKCVQAANGAVERLKWAVPKVAAREGVPVDALANYMAFRLTHDGITNWWGTAAKFQNVSEQPWETARNLFVRKIGFGSLNEVDRSLLQQAVSDIEV